MIDIIFLISIFIISALLSRLTISPRHYIQARWMIFTVVAALTLLVFNVESIATAFSPISESLNQIGIGYPRGWEIKTSQSDEIISTCYYLTFLSTFIVLLMSASHEHKEMNTLRKRDSLINWLGIVVFGWLLYVTFWSGSTLDSGPSGRALKLFFTSQLGIVAHQLIAIHVLPLLLGLHVRAVFSRNEARNHFQ